MITSPELMSTRFHFSMILYTLSNTSSGWQCSPPDLNREPDIKHQLFVDYHVFSVTVFVDYHVILYTSSCF